MKGVRARVIQAWCVELNAEVTISQARREFFCLEEPRAGFTFFCHDPACRSLPEKVAVSGVNYQVPAEESEKYKAAHFRAYKPHHEDCRWILRPEPVELPGESPEERRQRFARRKISDLVTVFDPRRKGSIDGESGRKSHDVSPGRAEGGGSWAGRAGNPGASRGETRTSDLDSLVDSYLEAKSKLSTADFRALDLQIVGTGRVRIVDYFQGVERADGAGVIFGGIKRISPYGYGFGLEFYDKREGAAVRLYVSSEQLRDFRYRRLIRAGVDEALESKGAKYLRAYCIGRFEWSPNHNSWNLVVDDLNHLVLRVVKKAVVVEKEAKRQ